MTKIIWTSDCLGCADYHRNKYKHWAKIVTSIDQSKQDGYAFTGDWLDYFRENEIEDADFVLEFDCNQKYRFYQVNDKENAIVGTRSTFISFRNECIEYYNKRKGLISRNNKLSEFTDEELLNEVKRRKII